MGPLRACVLHTLGETSIFWNLANPGRGRRAENNPGVVHHFNLQRDLSEHHQLHRRCSGGRCGVCFPGAARLPHWSSATGSFQPMLATESRIFSNPHVKNTTTCSVALSADRTNRTYRESTLLTPRTSQLRHAGRSVFLFRSLRKAGGATLSCSHLTTSPPSASVRHVLWPPRRDRAEFSGLFLQRIQFRNGA